MTSHSPASSPELPSFPSVLSGHLKERPLMAEVVEIYGRTCYEAGSAADAQAAKQVPAGWQPIETAPIVGNVILFDGDVCEGYWDDDRGEWWGANTHWTDAVGQPLYPTRWMPLPKPPAAPTGEQA